jgi:PHD/YefM family antitoxin component YafN of YafNO toxin-antitoxin module
MIIKPSAAIRSHYNEISDLCKKTGEPVYLTKNGEGDLVVMDINAFSAREAMLRLREELKEAEMRRQNGEEGYVSAEEVLREMREAIDEVENESR